MTFVNSYDEIKVKNENSLFAIIGFSLLLVATLWGSIGMPSVLKLYYLNKLEKQEDGSPVS